MSVRNERITDKEWNLIKGGMRRVFCRAEIRKLVLNRAEVVHSDPSRPRVKKWCRCAGCKTIVPKYTCDVDHIEPVIPIGRHMKDMEIGEVVDRIWCVESNLQVLCEVCHNEKSKKERKERSEAKKAQRTQKGD